MMQARLNSTIDLTPIIGLMLALLAVIFSASLGTHPSSELDMRPLDPAPGGRLPPPPPWFVTVDADGVIWAAQGEGEPQQVTRDTLLTIIPPGEPINLRGAAETPYGDFAELLMFLDEEDRSIRLINEDFG